MNFASDMLPSSAGLALRRKTRPLDPGAGVRLFAWSVAYVVLYVALDAASTMFPFGPIPVTPWNPQVGLAIAVIFAGGARYAPATIAATVVAEIVVRVSGGPAFDVLGGLSLGLAYVLTGWAFRRRDVDRNIARMDVLRDFLLISLVGTALGAFAYTGSFAMIRGDSATTVLGEMLRKWLGDYVGVIAFAPLLLALSDTDAQRPAFRKLTLDAVLFAAAVFALLALVFGLDTAEGHRLFYLLFVPLIYLAMRHDFIGAALGVACVQMALIAALIASGRSADAATDYQLLMGVLAATTLLLGSATTERRRALAELAKRSSELRTQQAALSDAMRVAAASETASTLAHEMSQPLSAIGTYARAGLEMLRRGAAEPADIAGVLDRIERETARSSEVVRRVRDFFRTALANREPTDLAALVHDAVDALRDRLARDGISLTLEARGDLPRVEVDRVQIGTVLHNLLGNAADALAGTAEPRTIRIGMRPTHDGEIEVDVEDSGPGVPADLGAALFEPLATTKPAGMGLGLAICRTIVQAHGGRLWLASSQPTLFRFTLPIHGQDQS